VKSCACESDGEGVLSVKYREGESVCERGVARLNVLQCIAVCCNMLQCLTVHCSVLQCVAVCCSVLQRVEVCCCLS